MIKYKHMSLAEFERKYDPIDRLSQLLLDSKKAPEGLIGSPDSDLEAAAAVKDITHRALELVGEIQKNFPTDYKDKILSLLEANEHNTPKILSSIIKNELNK
ncbi:MAG: hypothetical protein HY918_01395 [Candidatus Doudnabacteria bacterium]|nr:hypothetical protein [Candidatus Doudnabacteria bacterium]